jgi:molybdopterin-guanine dinucleotide biosynthesis protein A
MHTIGVILAGGLSRRMGQDKALLKLHNQQMLSRTFKALTGTSVNKVVISRNDDQKEHFADLIPNKGPLSGIHSIAARFPSANLLIVPVDLPFMDTESLQTLLDKGLKFERNVRYHEHNLPLFLRNSETLRQALDFTLSCSKNYSVQSLCSNFPLLEIQANKPSCLFNTNTPEQWQFASKELSNKALLTNTLSNPNIPYEAKYESLK